MRSQVPGSLFHKDRRTSVQGYLSLVHFQQYYAWMNLLHPEFGAFQILTFYETVTVNWAYILQFRRSIDYTEPVMIVI
jgi:hypothetical protein